MEPSAGTILLALRYLNNDDNVSVVPDVEKLDERCNLQFTAKMFDGVPSKYITVQTANKLFSHKLGGDQCMPPCAFLGTGWSQTTMPMVIPTGLSGYPPQLTHFETSSKLDNKQQYKLLGHLIPSNDGIACKCFA
eukprot:scaffold45612_cov51-Attheya_sp.AAC.2